MDAFNILFNSNHKGMKDLSNFKHFIGCDVSKNTLDFAIHEKGKDYRMFEHIQVTNNLEGFQAMRKWLRTFKIKLSDVVIAMEHTGSYSTALAEWSFKKGYTFVFLHPLDVKNAGARGRNKTDKVDSQFIADYVYTMREKLAPSQPEAPAIKRLRQLYNERRLAVKTRTAYLNQMKNITDKDTLKRQQKIVDAFDAQIKQIENAILLTVKSDQKIQNNYELLISIKGIGMINAAVTIIATGNFTRFQTARQYAKFCCVSPMSNQSGTSIRKGEHVSKAGHNEIKSVLTVGARSAIRNDKGLKAYYERKIAEGKTYGCVMNAVKFKLICRIFAVVERQTPYVEINKFRS